MNNIIVNTSNNPIPPLVLKLGYAGLIPFIGLALLVRLAPTPLNYLNAESLAGYGAVITSFMGAFIGAQTFTPSGGLQVAIAGLTVMLGSGVSFLLWLPGSRCIFTFLSDY
ncbi:DUF3429 domain-containing protein [Polynucleobacter necessarius]|uniref:DUF3429 domain-containing protein n=1 Tax=Polynucleobacter necessarius TaxID=576610 RepID=UPI0013B05D36|nr:DUF3429 domain-containing protein [Polynucleobacter necessarius]